eukprot:jgi/Mesvir1/14615/Mv05285-RA.1
MLGPYTAYRHTIIRVVRVDIARKMYMVGRGGHFLVRVQGAPNIMGARVYGKMSNKSGSYRQVYHGTAQRTPGGLTSSDLTRNKRKQIVPILKSEAGKEAYNRIEDWVGFSKRVHQTQGGDFKTALKTAKKMTDDYLRDMNLPVTAENKRAFWSQYVAEHSGHGAASYVVNEEDDDGF